tara:strand:+ start:171 stop:407 length:237 start_codon:yes stop_codon:yes gene_type:complete
MNITIQPQDRIELLKYVNVLREFNCNTSEKIPISYDHVCEIETLMFRLANLLQFEQPHKGGWYTDYQLKEHLPKEKQK